jgi:hypothetical protein
MGLQLNDFCLTFRGKNSFLIGEFCAASAGKDFKTVPDKRKNANMSKNANTSLAASQEKKIFPSLAGTKKIQEKKRRIGSS